MSSTPPIHQASRASTGALSKQPTLVHGITQQSTASAKSVAASDEAFRKALDRFCLRLSGEEEAAFRNTTFKALAKEMLVLEREQGRRKEMMNLARIQPFIEGMQHLGKTIEVFLNVNEVVCCVWGPIKFLLLTAANFTDSFETLLDAYAQLGEVLPLLAEYELLFDDNPHMIEALIYIYVDVLEFHQHAIRFFQGRKWMHFFKSMWKSFDAEFGGILKSLRRHKELVECRASLSQYRRYQEDMKEMKQKLGDIVAAEKEKKRVAVTEWLAVSEQAWEDHGRFTQIRQLYSTTTKWILDREYVKHWIEFDVPATPLLWMYGIPGAGKTILASAIIDECKQKKDFTTCFFYCHEGDQNSNSALGILKGLVYQLLHEHTATLLPLCYTRKSASSETTLRSLQQAKKVFEDCCSAVSKLFVVIDGLDECDLVERRQIIEILMEIVGQRDVDDEGKMRVPFVSQDYGDIRRALYTNAAARLTPRSLQLSDTDVTTDISTYVKIWADRIATRFSPFTEEMKEYVCNLTVANAKGMFLYAELVMQNLYKQPDREHVINAIKTENFPRGLQEAYERILQRIKHTSQPDEWAKAKRLLGWMVCAKRQLTWKEMQVAISMNLADQKVEYDGRRFRTHIHDTCGSLVLVTGDRVTLVHSTAKTFITNSSEGIHEPSVECELTTLCLQYLTFPCFDEDGHDDKQLRQMMLAGHFAFQDYAVAKWFYHVNAMVKSGKKFLEEAVGQDHQLQALSTALDDFMIRYDEENWEGVLVQQCETSCSVFKGQNLYENLLLLTSHIYTFQEKGFDLRHKISIKSLATALERNRKLLENFPAAKDTKRDDLDKYKQFYNEKKPFKCNKITCRYFSEGFTDEKARKKHVNIHDRPFQCEVSDCLGAEGFANDKDRQKHIRAFHPEMSDLALTFISTTAKRPKSDFACTICGKTFTRDFHRRHHEASHRGERPYECPECGKAFTRSNDMRRHVKSQHERGK